MNPNKKRENKFSVIMPTYNQCSFIRRAIISILHQSYNNWELIIVNDGCTDSTEEFIIDFLSNKNIKYLKNKNNTGLGHALNQGIEIASGNIISYLPSDDFYYMNHLESIERVFRNNKKAVLVFSGLRYECNDTLYHINIPESCYTKKGEPLQLVQVAHKKTNDKWIERDTWISDDLFAMFWKELSFKGLFIPTREITCQWTSHPNQRHKIISERFGGGLNQTRQFYKINKPIKIRVSQEKLIDEKELYASYRHKFKRAKHPLKILLLGELSYNPERIYALEQAGHILYGLWAKPFLTFNTVGKLPFGHIKDIDYNNWESEIERIKPDIIYAMLNWGIVSFAYNIIKKVPHIPYAWHFKEGPSQSRRNGTWNELIYLFQHASINIYINEVIKDWYEQFLPFSPKKRSLIIDGDLPKQDIFSTEFSEKKSIEDGDIHTVVAGRLIGISEDDILILTQHKIHIHVYLENFHSSNNTYLRKYQSIFPRYFHIHSHCPATNWVKEFSKYDAGWLHCFDSYNDGDLMRASWDDLNIPARLSTYMAAAIPVIQKYREPNIVAIASIIKKQGIGILFNDFKKLAEQLNDKEYLRNLTRNVMNYRQSYAFDYYISEIIETFEDVVKHK